MMKLKIILTCATAGVMLSACTQGATGPPSISAVNPLTNSKLQMAVGTANVAGLASGFNVVSTMRQPNGLSAVLVDTPTLTGPFTLPAAQGAVNGIDPYSTSCAFILPPGPPPPPGCRSNLVHPLGGPSAQEVAVGGTLSGTSQFLLAGTPVCDSNAPCNGIPPNTTTFGQSGGVFGMGLAPYNNTNLGVAYSYVPYIEPMFDTTGGGGTNTYTPWGGPPAFDPNHDNMGTRDGLFNLGAPILGVGEGITMFEHVTPATGTYTLSVEIPTSPTTSGTITATASLSSTTLLPTITAPTILLDGLGGGTFSGTLPAPITEGYVEIVDLGNGGNTCQGPIGTESGLPVYYTIHVSGSGPYSAVLPPMDGPNISGNGQQLQPSPSICTALQNGGTGDTFQVLAFGFDYPIYAASYPNSLGNQAPTLLSGPQADITMSAVGTATSTVKGRPITLRGVPDQIRRHLRHPYGWR
jgi:hypothetical protein